MWNLSLKNVFCITADAFKIYSAGDRTNYLSMPISRGVKFNQSDQQLESVD